MSGLGRSTTLDCKKNKTGRSFWSQKQGYKPAFYHLASKGRQIWFIQERNRFKKIVESKKKMIVDVLEISILSNLFQF